MSSKPPKLTHVDRWERREALLQEACVQIEKLHGEGGEGLSIIKAQRVVSRKFHHRRLGNNHKLKCSFKSLRRFWYQWLKAGRDPSVFQLNYKPGNPRNEFNPLLAAVLGTYCLINFKTVNEAFVDLNADDRHSSVSLRSLYRLLPVRLISSHVREHRRLMAQKNKLIAKFHALAVGTTKGKA